MAKSDSMFREGLISSKAAAKLKALRGTKHQKSKMVDFDDRGGRRDQGGVRDRGAPHASVNHIDKNQDMGTPARASGKPSKGGSVGKYGQPGVGEINEADEQTPAFPKQGSGKGRAGSRTVAAIPRQGGIYGGGGRDTQ